MIAMENLLSMSLLAVIIDRFVLDRCFGTVSLFKKKGTLVPSLALGGCVTGSLLLAAAIACSLTFLVLLPLGLDYLFLPVFVIAIAFASLAGELLLSRWRPFAPLYRLFARTTSIGALLFLTLLAPLPEAIEQLGLSLRTSMWYGLTIGITFTLVRIVFCSLSNSEPTNVKTGAPRALASDLLVAALLLLALSGISTLHLLPW